MVAKPCASTQSIHYGGTGQICVGDGASAGGSERRVQSEARWQE